MEVNDKVYARINLRPHYKNMKIRDGVLDLDGKIFFLKVLWKCDDYDKYPGEYALSPVKPETIDMWIEKHDLIWIASGDIDILRGGCHEEQTVDSFIKDNKSFFDSIATDKWPDISKDQLKASNDFIAPVDGFYSINGSMHYKKKGDQITRTTCGHTWIHGDHALVINDDTNTFQLYFKGNLIMDHTLNQKEIIAKILSKPTDKHLSGYLSGPVKDGFETVVMSSGRNFAIYNYKLPEEKIKKLFENWGESNDMFMDRYKTQDTKFGQTYKFCSGDCDCVK